MRILAKFASVELYQLTLISICLVSGWITGHLVRILKLKTLEKEDLKIGSYSLLLLIFLDLLASHYHRQFENLLAQG